MVFLFHYKSLIYPSSKNPSCKKARNHFQKTIKWFYLTSLPICFIWHQIPFATCFILSAVFPMEACHGSCKLGEFKSQELVFCVLYNKEIAWQDHHRLHHVMRLCKKHQDKYGFDLGPLALLVVHGKLCLLMSKKVSTWVVSMFGLMLLGQPQEYFSLLRVEKAVTADQAGNTLKEQKWIFCQHHYFYKYSCCARVTRPSIDITQTKTCQFVSKQNFPFTTNEAREIVPNPYLTQCFLHNPINEV